jgi:molybdate transport system regulatory protein
MTNLPADSAGTTFVQETDSGRVPLGRLEVRSKVWIEASGGTALCDWLVEILKGVERTGSLTRTAEELEVPYRMVRKRLGESEERLGVALVESTTGADEDGVGVLTPAARELLRRYDKFSDGIREYVDRRFKEAFR